MEEPDKRDYNHASNLEDTVRNLREENAKLLQLLRTQGLLLDPSLNTNGKSSESISSTVPDSTNITFDHSDLTLTTNSTTITNQINHQHIHNHGPMNQQNYNEQTIQGNQSNINPNFNTVIQTNTQPFVQNNSNTLVQNNTNLIQPINLVNFNNVSLDSIQSFFASQNNVMYLSQTSTSEKTTTTSTTTTSTTSISPNCLPNDSSSSSEKPPISIRIKPLINRQHQELVPVIPKMKAEHYENLTRQYASSSNSDTTNLLDNDSNQKFPRPIRPKLSSRTNSLRIYKPVVLNETQSSSNILRPSSPYVDSSPTISLFSSPNYSSSPSTTATTTNYQSQTSSIENQYNLPISLVHSKSSDLSISSTNKKSNKPRQRNRKKPSNTSSTITITLNHGRPLASTLSNTQRTTTSNNPITKRSITNRKPTKRNIKTLVHSQSESILPINSSSPSTAFAESVSGLLENLDQELMASNFLSQTTESHLLSDEITTTSMPTLDEFNNRLEHETHDFNVESEQITSFMSEEDMRLVEMNFDENTFLKQFDLEDAGIRLSVNSDQNLFASILTDNPNQMNDQSITQTNSSVSHPPSTFPSSSLINNNVFTTVVPLGSQRQQQQQILQTNTLLMTNMTSLLPEEGVQLTARHIEPSQVATYESVNYQNILDDLVMVTDQDALRHAQATAADDPTVISTDFSFALLEETNEIINSANIQLTTEQASTVLNELQYFYPIEQQAELTQKQGEIQPNQQQPIVILENLQSNIIASTTLNENLPDNSIINTSVTNLSSLLELESTDSLVPPLNVPTTTTQLITPGRSNKSSSNDNQSIDFDSLLSSSHIQNTFSNDTANIDSPILDTLALPSSALQLRETPESCALIESSTSTSHSSIFIKPIQDEMIIDSGRLDQLNTDKSTLNNDDNVIEDLLRDTTITTTDPYEIIETQGKTPVKKYLIIDNVDQLLDQIEPRKMSSKLLERTFSRYQQKYHSNLQHQQNLQIKQSQETTPVIPPVKLRLHQIYKQKSPSPQPLEHSSLKITLCPKLSPNVSSERKTQKKKIHKNKNKKSHHHHRHQKKKTLTNQSPEMESAGITRFEQPLNQLYNQTAPATLIEAQPKNETHTQSPIQSESQQLPSSPAVTMTTTLHSGFIIDEQISPSSTTSLEHRQSSPPLLFDSQDKNDKLKANYSHIFTFDNYHEHHQNNNAFITPPPETDLNLQQHKGNSYENFSRFSNSPNKKKHHLHNHHRHHHRKSSTTSTTSSKSLTNTDYALDTEALEPVSPTPLETSKQKNSSLASSSSSLSGTATTNYNDSSPPYVEHHHHHQQKPMKDYHSKKSSSSSTTRSSRPMPSSSQSYQQPRSLSNHTYRTSQDPPLLPPSHAPMHLDPYAQPYHHFVPRGTPVPPPFFNFPFPHPFLNPRSTVAAATASSSRFHHHSMKYPHHHPSHIYPTHQSQYSYHPHLQRQQQYNNSNYMSSRNQHSFNR